MVGIQRKTKMLNLKHTCAKGLNLSCIKKYTASVWFYCILIFVGNSTVQTVHRSDLLFRAYGPLDPSTPKSHRSRVTSGGCRTKKQMAPNEARLHYPRGTPLNNKYPNHSQLAIKDAGCRCCQCFPDPPKGRWCAIEKPWSLIVRLGHGFHQEEHSIMHDK